MLPSEYANLNESCFDKNGQLSFSKGIWQNVAHPELIIYSDYSDSFCIRTTNNKIDYIIFLTHCCTGWWGKYKRVETEFKVIS